MSLHSRQDCFRYEILKTKLRAPEIVQRIVTWPSSTGRFICRRQCTGSHCARWRPKMFIRAKWRPLSDTAVCVFDQHSNGVSRYRFDAKFELLKRPFCLKNHVSNMTRPSKYRLHVERWEKLSKLLVWPQNTVVHFKIAVWCETGAIETAFLSEKSRV